MRGAAPTRAPFATESAILVPDGAFSTARRNVRARLHDDVTRRPATLRSPLPTLFAVTALLLASLALQGPAQAQERHNFLAINGDLNDEAGPYYFIAHGDSANAFMRASAFALAADLELRFDDASKQLVFRNGVQRVVIDATADVARGLERHREAVRYDGGSLDSPLAILVNGVSYVPITPVVAALGGDSDWHPSARVITIELPDRNALAQVGPPRTGHTDGVSRVAIDIPSGHPYQVAVNGSALAVLLPGVQAPAFSRALDDPNVASVAFDVIDGVVALVVRTTFPLSASGQGFRVGQLVRDGQDVLYVDFAPVVAGAAAAPMDAGVVGAPPAAARAVLEAQPRRYTVVIDAGHGGHDPGAVAPWGREKEIVLDVALRLKHLLEAQGVHVIMTRDGDSFLSLPQRSTFATTDRNIFVSIHANGADSSAAEGIETWVFGRPLDPSLIERAVRENGGGDVGAARTEEAARIANDIAGDILRETQLNYSLALANIVQDRLVGATGARDRGVRQNLFYVIRNSRIPAILVELGFVSHPDEGRRLVRAEYQETLAEALADAVMEFLDNGGARASR
jgi:N-acetylmuramoyl-L-alanine amidase